MWANVKTYVSNKPGRTIKKSVSGPSSRAKGFRKRIFSILTVLVLMFGTMVSFAPIINPNFLPNAKGIINMNLFFDDMEAGGPADMGLWTIMDVHWSSPPQPSATLWEYGIPTPPPGSYSPTRCWGTELSGSYSTPSENILITPYIDLTGEAVISAKLTFWHYYSFEMGDGGLLQINPRIWDVENVIEPVGGYPGIFFSQWGQIMEGYNGSTPGWQQVTFDLSEYVGQVIRIGFRFCAHSGNMINRGWYVDDVSVDVEWFDGPKIGPDQTKIGLAGETLSYTLTITNYNVVPDYIDIRYTNTQNWQVRILDSTNYFPLPDNGGIIGLPDVYPQPNESIDIIVNVTIPPGLDEWDVTDITTIYVVSSKNPMNQDTAVLRTKTPWPDVGIEAISTPNLKKVGENINITVTVKNYGDWTATFEVEGILDAPMIYPPSTNEPSIQQVGGLKANETVDLKWSFTPAIACEYTFSATTLLNIDQFVFNNRSQETMHIQDMLWTDDMELGGDAKAGRWTHFMDGASPSFTDWELGQPTFGPPSGSVPSPTNCWGTDLDAAYQEDTNCYLFTPQSRAFDFSGYEEIILSFSHWWRLQSTPSHGEDVGQIIYTFDPDPISYVYLPGIEFSSNSTGWEYNEIDMTSYVRDQPYVRFGWRLYENIGANKFEPNKWPGWYVDDVSVWASPARPELIITEIVDSGANEYIEVFNEGSLPARIADYGLTKDRGATWLTSGSWSTSVVLPGEHAFYSIPGGGELNDQGDTIGIVNRSIPQGLITDEIAYGQKGTVPDPLLGESSARYWDGFKYRDEWARDPTATIGLQNNGPGEVDFKHVVLNEVLYNPGSKEGFIEMRYVGYPGNDPDIDMTGWRLVVGNSVFTIPAVPFDPVLNLLNPFYVVTEGMFPGLLGTIDVNGDNIYLYTNTGEFVDEVGWSKAHTPKTSMSRVPDGYGVKKGFKKHGLMGYDDPSSIAAGWQFLRTPSKSIVAIETDQTDAGDSGWTVVYNINITNHQSAADYIDLINTTMSPGWTIGFYLQNNVTPLMDNDGDGLIDTGLLPPNSVMWIRVKITLPFDHVGDLDETIITALSSIDPEGCDTVTLVTETYPHIELYKSSSRNEIWLNGSGMQPQATTLSLHIRGSGLAQTVQYPQDVVFCIDSSGSMVNSDPSNLRIDAAKSYVNDMRIPDRGAVVDFDEDAILVGDDHLSSDYILIKNNIDKIDSAGGTAIGAALQLANDELISNGKLAHIWIIILLTDGLTLDKPLSYSEADRAAQNDIKVYTIGLGSGADEDLLQDIADITGGKYYPAPTPEYLEGIYNDIRTQTLNIAGKDLVVGDNVYFVRDVLPPGIDFVPGTFNIIPSKITQNASGYTILEWEVDRVLIGEELTYTFDVVSNNPGLVQTNFIPDSRVRYIKWTGDEVVELFPEVLVNVLLGPPIPPQLYTRQKGDDVELYWIPKQTTGIDHYLIYKSPNQTGFDFSSIFIDTSKDSDFGVIPKRTSWNITGGATGSYLKEEYYIIRAVNSVGKTSMTSNTVGKWTKTFYAGVNTFSLPLEPFETKTVDWFRNEIPGCEYIKWMNKTTQEWVVHDLGKGPGVDDADVKMGEGYEISVSLEVVYTFCGSPAAQIRYLEDELPAPGNFQVCVKSIFGDVDLTWDEVPGADHYVVYRSSSRMGLNEVSLFPYWETTYNRPSETYFTDYNAAYYSGSQYYYLVCAVKEPGLHMGLNGTYSVGVWTGSYLRGYDTFALPLKLKEVNSTDWYCDDIPNTVGMNYYIYSEQRWGWHATRMPQMAYDTDIITAEGYQISTNDFTKYTFIGE